MKTTVVCFAASRYWTDARELNETYEELKSRLQSNAEEFRLVVDGEGVEDLSLKAGDTLVIVPMSGAVQKDILKAAERFDALVLYGAYIQGNASEQTTGLMLKLNAAPTLMDSWSVLRKRHQKALLALNGEELTRLLRTLSAYQSLRGAKLLLIGEPEPWVISVSRNLEDYRRLGIAVEQVSQQDVADLYAAITPEEAKPYFEKYVKGAESCMEPTEQDIENAARMTAALLKTLEKHQADGMALACFNLLSLGTTSCLGVSYINDCTDKIAACEGDLDSAVTMLMLKRLTKTKPWMANPGLHPMGVINFSHCTAPLAIQGGEDCPFILRNHHESGIGASLQVKMPQALRLTACRISGVWGTYTVQGATGEPGPREEGCRTQLYVCFDDFDRYVRTALGCHQVFCFEDVAKDFALLAEWMGLKPEGE
ncbi:MAG: hypothetical protein GXY67_06120 [Clostridiales bacterium]|nr:hypothetical protein [Clostridiales bacterium]